MLCQPTVKAMKTKGRMIFEGNVDPAHKANWLPVNGTLILEVVSTSLRKTAVTSPGDNALLECFKTEANQCPQ
jgi:hypothetical protein